ncbi:MAG TPA: dihydrodipicolinate synthase family protein [Tepidisphaeraceae bacterium]|jgi:dihydrodipicolinate synthase/N-acetylneuraminate lyase
MITSLASGRLFASVLAVPPLCRNDDLSLNPAENARLIRHIESGGVTTLLYGGNANFYHIPLSEYDATLAFLAEAAAPDTLVIPSVGPVWGTMMDQAAILRKHRFPTAMVLPQQGITTSQGVAEGVRRFVEAAGIPALLYIKNDGFIEPDDVAYLAEKKLISGIKYATVRADPANDPYLKELLFRVDRNLVISGIGEQPAITHLRDFGLPVFTSGCVCVAPALSAEMLAALRRKDYREAWRIREIFKALEDLRNAINPIRVLHEAVRLAGIAETGKLLPLLSNIEDPAQLHKIAAAAKHLRNQCSVGVPAALVAR